MSISSCDQFLCGPYLVVLKRLRNAIQVDLLDAPAGTANSITNNNISSGTVIIDGARLAANIGTNTAYNSLNHFKCTGFRLFMINGFLKAVKREVGMSYFVTTASSSATMSIGANIPKKNVRESYYHPSTLVESCTLTNECMARLDELVVDLAAQKGVSVPEKFRCFGQHVKGVGHTHYMAVLDWLAYPLVREIDNPVVCKNMIEADRKIIAPNFIPMNFKELIQHYYGTVTGKLLEETWKLVTVGADLRMVMVDPVLENHKYFANVAYEFVREEGDVKWYVGDRHIQLLIFTLGAAVFKSMGFDYFYQVIGRICEKLDRLGAQLLHENSTKSITENLQIILKHISHKKLISTMFPENGQPDFHSMNDTARMLREYQSFEEIPKSLRLQYPKGLTVDFKFKTMKELHDKISTQYTIIKTEANNKEIPVSMEYDMLHGRQRDGLKLLVLHRTSVLAVWGKLLNICIASYGDRAAAGETLLLGVEQEDRIKYCIEFRSVKVSRHALEPIARPANPNEAIIRPNIVNFAYPRLLVKHVGCMPDDVPEEEGIYYEPSIIQFRGDRNGNPTDEDKTTVLDMLVEWAQENKEALLAIDGVLDEFSKYSIDDLALRDGVPDQLLMHPAQYEAYNRLINVPFRDPGPPPQVEDREIHINIRHEVVANPLVDPNNDIFLLPNGDLPVIAPA